MVYKLRDCSCEKCGGLFKANRPTQKFCSVSCANSVKNTYRKLPPGFGYKSPETRKKIAEALQGRSLSEDHKTNISLGTKAASQELMKSGRFNKFQSPGEVHFKDYLASKGYVHQYIFQVGRMGYDNSYRVLMDFFHPQKLINIEIDGASHEDSTGDDLARDRKLLTLYRIRTIRINEVQMKITSVTR